MEAIVHGTRAQRLWQQHREQQSSHSAKFVIGSICIPFGKGCDVTFIRICRALVLSEGRVIGSAADWADIIPGFA